ncbi:hypothetical protein VHA01S_031_00340 [Vibrio halioticoli NBRC 102217]|uniref:Nudix hydrolase domain-containing protein n=1 Tax=Vibrio halioticoli NBRC 102217 TaxID=1219072 RepID=V5FME8_9VIBR|nr:NUDIX domain-containing protein [Vibrio halioticoli]GAD90022.1 hypothetical protein VHA01S_031_00340 [Vibrio halioticoli NBRC 102217]
MIPINTQFVSGVALSEFDGDTKILLLKRTKGEYWCHVAGKIEDGETGWQTIIREFDEETSIKVSQLYNSEYLEQFYEAKSNQLVVIPSFVVLCERHQEVILNPEHTDYQWCTLEEAKAIAPFHNQHKLYDHIWEQFVLSPPSEQRKISLT